MFQKNFIVCVACFILAFGIIIAATSMLDKTREYTEDVQEEESTGSVFDEEKAEQEEDDKEASGKKMKKKILKTLFEENSTEEYDKLKVRLDHENNVYNIFYHPTEGSWNETDFIRNQITRYVAFCEKAYELKDPKPIAFHASIDIDNGSDNVTTLDGFTIHMTPEQFAGLDWEDLEDEPVWKILSDNSEELWIAPEIKDKVNTEKIYYETPF